jgi:hypothetical protein
MHQAALPQSDTIRLSARTQNFSHEEKRNWIIAAILILLITLFWLDNQRQTKQGIFALPTTGLAAPWSAQFNLAQTEAARRDKGALLVYVFASPVDDSDTADSNKALRVIFRYFTPSGSTFDVSIIDVNPPILESVGINSFEHDLTFPSLMAWPWDVSNWYRDHAAEAGNSLQSIAISPRQAIELTLSESITKGDAVLLGRELQLALPTQQTPDHNILVSHRSLPGLNRSPQWDLLYLPSFEKSQRFYEEAQKRYPDNFINSYSPYNVEDLTSNLKVSASTGDILSLTGDARAIR